MKVLVFDLYGKFAHFRKFYTNSSSLSYSIPPRTTAEGMIGALLGYERDSYYDILGVDRLNIGIKKMGKTRKIMQSLNYIKADSPGKLTFPEEHTQIPFEILVGDDEVRYRVYLHHEDKGIYEKIKIRIINNRPVFPLYFGCVPFSCYLQFVDEYEGIWANSSEYEFIATAIRHRKIKEIDIESIDGTLIKERMTRDFGKERVIKDVDSYIYEQEGKPLKVKVNGEYLHLSNGENILFM